MRPLRVSRLTLEMWREPVVTGLATLLRASMEKRCCSPFHTAVKSNARPSALQLRLAGVYWKPATGRDGPPAARPIQMVGVSSSFDAARYAIDAPSGDQRGLRSPSC